MGHPLFNIGDEVWISVINTDSRRNECPDCLGAGTWQAISPAGMGYIMDCPRCKSGYTANRDLSLNYHVQVPDRRNGIIEGVEKNPFYRADEQSSYWRYRVGAGGYHWSKDEHELYCDASSAFRQAEWQTLWSNLGAAFRAAPKMPLIPRQSPSDYTFEFVGRQTLKQKALDAEWERDQILSDLSFEYGYGAEDVNNCVRKILIERDYLEEEEEDA